MNKKDLNLLESLTLRAECYGLEVQQIGLTKYRVLTVNAPVDPAPTVLFGLKQLDVYLMGYAAAIRNVERHERNKARKAAEQ